MLDKVLCDEAVCNSEARGGVKVTIYQWNRDQLIEPFKILYTEGDEESRQYVDHAYNYFGDVSCWGFSYR